MSKTAYVPEFEEDEDFCDWRAQGPVPDSKMVLRRFGDGTWDPYAHIMIPAARDCEWIDASWSGNRVDTRAEAEIRAWDGINLLMARMGVTEKETQQ